VDPVFWICKILFFLGGIVIGGVCLISGDYLKDFVNT